MGVHGDYALEKGMIELEQFKSEVLALGSEEAQQVMTFPFVAAVLQLVFSE
jgi:hypothetical protein